MYGLVYNIKNRNKEMKIDAKSTTKSAAVEKGLEHGMHTSGQCLLKRKSMALCSLLCTDCPFVLLVAPSMARIAITFECMLLRV